ncbi:MAG: class I SAM-dependent methyltransferase [Candidatus Rokubacteria bacterium]|nr:class I SAM-dependent methyltransferase [Candidatus Rokubacteria bacterium]
MRRAFAHRRRAAGLSLILLLSGFGCAPLTLPGPEGPAPNLGEFVPTPLEVAMRMLELAEVTKDDVVYDLGSGDGRIVILAAKRHGARAVGVEIDARLVWFSERNAKREKVDHLVSFRHADALTVDLSPATVVTLYLTKEANLLLRPILRRQLRPGARIVSHAHDMGDWAAERVERVTSLAGEEHTLYLWRIAK